MTNMGARALFAAWLITGFLVATPSPADAAPPAGVDRVLVVVIDGMQPEDLSPALTPNLWALRADGEARVYPHARGNMLSETNPNHVAMVTGTFGDTHGIFANELLDLEDGEESDLDFPAHILVPTLFDAIERQRPSLRTAAVVGKEKLKTLFDCTRPTDSDECGPSAENPERLTVEHVRPDVLRGASTKGEAGEPPAEPASGSGYSADELVMEVAIDVVRTQDPHFTLINLPDVDGLQHLFGPHSLQGRAAVVNADANVGRLVDELRGSGKWTRSLLIVLSDHSFQEAGEQRITQVDGVELAASSPLTSRLSGSTIVLSELFSGVCVSAGTRASFGWVSFGGAASVYITDPGYDPYAGTPLSEEQRGCLKELRGRALARGGVEEALYRLPVEGETGLLGAVHPEWRLNTPRAGELILTADNSHGFLPSRTSEDAASPGVHGGPAAQPIAFLVASGSPLLVPGVDLASARPIDIAPTVAALLRVDPPAASEGRVLSRRFLSPSLKESR
jgi:ectonucleotide pyrophosphatase/phosphodiesterase family protein 5